MKYQAGVTIEKSATFEFPDEMFSAEHMKDVQEYSESGRDIKTPADLRAAVIEHWALYGEGYAEWLGVNIGVFGGTEKNAPNVKVYRDDEEVMDLDIYEDES